MDDDARRLSDRGNGRRILWIAGVYEEIYILASDRALKEGRLETDDEDMLESLRSLIDISMEIDDDE